MSNLALHQVRVVLVEPAGPLNIGSVARVMKNMELRQLILVNPLCHPYCHEARQMAVHAADVLSAAQIVKTLPDALVGCRRAIATTARDRALNMPLEHPRLGLPWLINGKGESTTADAALIFGPEDRGLSNAELNYAQRCIRIPSSPTYASLNLAQAVAICCYELYQIAHGFDQTNPLGSHSHRKDLNQSYSASLDDQIENQNHAVDVAASLDVLEGYYQQLERTLLDIGYLYPHTASRRMEKFRRLFNRAQLSESEVSMLRGILRQVEWAIQNK
jgi:tRNA/rRNA methyltransferase